MSTVRIAVASTPLAATLVDAVPAALAAVEEAANLRAKIVCLPETGMPGHRSQRRAVPDVTNAEVDEAIRAVAEAARRANIVVIVGIERPTQTGREIRSAVIDADGGVLGEQVKTQIDPSEERDYVPGIGRHIFNAAGLTFGIAICHEAFRYPEISRSLVLRGAKVIFVPQHVTTDDGSLATTWCAPSNPYNEKALLSRALENTAYIATANTSGDDQGSASCIIDPKGRLLASVAYGVTGVAAADIDPALADGLIARRWAPERNVDR